MMMIAPKQKSFERVRPLEPSATERQRVREDLSAGFSAGLAAGLKLREDIDKDPGRRPRLEGLRGDSFERDPIRRPRMDGYRGDSYDRDIGRRPRVDESPPPAPRRRNSGFRSPLASPFVDFEQVYGFSFYPEDEPSSPATTTTTTETTTTSSSTRSSSTSEFTRTHWLPIAFNQGRPVTGFRNEGQLLVYIL